MAFLQENADWKYSSEKWRPTCLSLNVFYPSDCSFLMWPELFLRNRLIKNDTWYGRGQCHPSVCLFVRLPVCPSVCLSVRRRQCFMGHNISWNRFLSIPWLDLSWNWKLLIMAGLRQFREYFICLFRLSHICPGLSQPSTLNSSLNSHFVQFALSWTRTLLVMVELKLS